MKIRTTVFLAALGLSLALQVFSPVARANSSNEATYVTVTEPVQVPGHILPPGEYLFVLSSTDTERNIIQIFNRDRTVLYATLSTIPCFRMEPTADTLITVHERPKNQPEAIATWFYPGHVFGHEFLY